MAPGMENISPWLFYFCQQVQTTVMSETELDVLYFYLFVVVVYYFRASFVCTHFTKFQRLWLDLRKKLEHSGIATSAECGSQ